MMQWYYYKHDQQHGPVDESEIRRLLVEGVLSSQDFVWNPTLGSEWVMLKDLGDTFANADGQPSEVNEYSGVPAGGTGDMHNAVLMQQAREALRGNWGIAIGASLIYFVAANLLAAVDYVGGWINLIIEGPFRVGLAVIFLHIVRVRETPDMNQLFKGFEQTLTSILAYLLMLLFILLWALLLIIPGIAAAFSYTMTYYIIADHPGIRARDAIARSKAMMYGRRIKLMGLYFRFIGWFLLGIVTFGVGFVFVLPYLSAAHAAFYEDIRDAPLVTKT